MPFKSKKQMAYMYSQEPAVAKKFAEHTSKNEMESLLKTAKKKKIKLLSRVEPDKKVKKK